MVDFMAWQCRNCYHWHDWESSYNSPTDICRERYYPLDGDPKSCLCSNWESIDNLVYLEMKSGQRNTL